MFQQAKYTGGKVVVPALQTNFRLHNEGAVEIQMISFKWTIGVIVRPPPLRKYAGNTAEIPRPDEIEFYSTVPVFQPHIAIMFCVLSLSTGLISTVN